MQNSPGDLIAITTDAPIEAVAATVAAALDLTLLPRESSYWGDPYYSAWPASAVKLTSNRDPMFTEGDPPEDEWFSSAASDAAYLLWDTDDPASALAALSAVGLDAKLIAGHS